MLDQSVQVANMPINEGEMAGVKQFCVDEALEKALVVFWQKGYEATSLRDLLEQMGIQKGSFYATFSSKRDVYIKALKHYCEKQNSLLQKTTESGSPKDVIEGLLKSKVEACATGSGSMGCMGVNAAMELAPCDSEIAELIKTFFSKQENTLKDLLQRGQDNGQLSSSIDVDGVSKTLFALLMGMSILARARVDSDPQATIVKQVLRLLED